jgi:hypothetical protein
MSGRRKRLVILAVSLLLIASAAATARWYFSIPTLDVRARVIGPPTLKSPKKQSDVPPPIPPFPNIPPSHHVNPLLRPPRAVDNAELRAARPRFNVIYNDLNLDDCTRAQLVSFLNT